MVYFRDDGITLSETHRQQLKALVVKIGGKSLWIEIRGHTTRLPVDKKVARDHTDLAFKRALAVRQFLVDVQKIPSNRLRLSIAGPNEPIYLGLDPARVRDNARVDVFLLNQNVDNLSGTKDQRDARFTK